MSTMSSSIITSSINCNTCYKLYVKCDHKNASVCCVNTSAKLGHLKCLKFSKKMNVPFTAFTFENAVCAGNVDVLKYLMYSSCPVKKHFLVCNALSSSNPMSSNYETLRFLHENNIVNSFVEYDDIYTAIYFNRLDCIMYLVPHWYDGDLHSLAIAALELNRLPIYNYLESFITDRTSLRILKRQKRLYLLNNACKCM